MRTEEDLRAVFRTIADEVDTTEVEVITQPTPLRRIRRVVLPVALAAGVAAIVAVGAVVTNGRITQPPPVVASPQPLVFSSDAALTDLPKGAAPAENIVNRGGTESLVVQLGQQGGSDAWMCVVTVGRGDTPRGAFTAVKSTTVGSDPARIGRGDPEGSTDPEVQQRLRVQWQPAPNRWADSTCAGETGDLPIARRVGASLRLGAAPFQVPWTAAQLPNDLAVVQVTRQPATSGVPRLWVTLAAGVGPSYRPGDGTKPTVFAELQSMTDFLDSTGGSKRYEGERQPDLDGRQVWLAPMSSARPETMLTLVDGDHVFSLTSEELTGEQVLGIAKAMTFASDLGRESTWGSLADLPW